MRKVFSSLGVLAATALSFVGLTGTAQAAYYHDFFLNYPAFDASDNNGRFTGQVNFSAPGVPMAWSWDLAPHIEAIATSPMDCSAGLVQPTPPYHDRHPSVPVTYLWHSTVTWSYLGTPYDMWGNCRFNVNVGGRPGVANLKLDFRYTINKIPRPLAEDEQGSKFSSNLEITYLDEPASVITPSGASSAPFSSVLTVDHAG
ncbi:hypothetical protein AB0H34_46790 [Saccharopolyspora shandongensis]|uniref:hypothetical protein n=1 Tax=Saccharopolyspora shandongensis TaxID=418495 RepID=UPI0033FE4798